MNLEIRDDRFRKIVAGDAELERLATGFLFTEGPAWHPYEKHLIFSDMPGDHMRRWSAGAGITSFRRPSNKANGNTYDRSGRLVTCEHATSRLTRTRADGTIEVLATRFDGKELNSPNDVVVKSDGSIWFSDPIYGRMEYYGIPREPQLTFRGVYRLSADGRALAVVANDFGQPNGLCFSLDERRLFVNDTERKHIRVFDVIGGAKIENGRVWAETTGAGEGAPDGMKIDSAGNLFCCGPGGVHVFDERANCLGVIRLPQVAANFTWGDDDLCSLFVTASDSLYRVRVRIAGRPLF